MNMAGKSRVLVRRETHILAQHRKLQMRKNAEKGNFRRSELWLNVMEHWGFNHEYITLCR